jgi:short-subunit dehydrogenase
MSDLRKKWVLITGASSGFGIDYAHIFAEMGAHVVLTARRENDLQNLARELETKYGIQALCIACDLAEKESPQILYDWIKGRGIKIEVLINNAGYGIYSDFADTPWDKLEAMLQVNILALTQLTSLFLADMKQVGRGHIMLVSSIAAYQPSPTYAAYAAAKSYVLYLGEALNYELRGTGIKVSVLSPGVSKTSFLKVAGQKPSLYQRLVMMESRPVAQMAVKALMRGMPSLVPGFLNKISVFLIQLMPRWIQVRMVDLLMKTT